jgi:hypothetical protein
VSIFRNDKVILIKEYDKLKMVGSEYEVANITDTSVVLRDAVRKIAVAAIGIEDFDRYFKKTEEVKGWTDWEFIIDALGNTIASYRTNQKKVQIRTSDGYRAEATCNKCDEFNLAFGVQLACARAMDKSLKDRAEKFEQELKEINSQIVENRNMIKRMINSMDKKED